MEIILVLIATAIGAAVGGWFGSLYTARNEETKSLKKRALALKALNLFEKYSKQSYKAAAPDFNTTFNTSEKRAILVLLDKIGVQIEFSIIGGFNINTVSFKDKVIDKDEIENMKSQVESGNCDNFFFSDVDLYFNKNMQTRALRSIAIRYVQNVLCNTTFDKKTGIQQSKDGWNLEFTPGELNCVLVFRKQACDGFYYDEKGIFKKSSEELLISEIKQGIWDKYLDWDIGSYLNLYSQKNLADTISSAFSNMMSLNAKQNSDQNNIQPHHSKCANYKPIEEQK